MKRPFIHLFSTSAGYYFYDVNTSNIMQVTKDAYLFLKLLVEGNNDLSAKYDKEAALNEINKLISMGF